MNRPDILLKEYEVCQQQINSLSSRYWVIFAILVSLDAALTLLCSAIKAQARGREAKELTG